MTDPGPDVENHACEKRANRLSLTTAEPRRWRRPESRCKKSKKRRRRGGENRAKTGAECNGAGGACGAEGGENDVTKAIKIQDMTAIDETSVQILRAIALHLGDREQGRVNYMLIAKSLNVRRSVVRSAVNRMISKGILEKHGDELAISNAVMVD